MPTHGDRLVSQVVIDRYDNVIASKSWSYDAAAKVMVSYDNVEMSKKKVDFIKQYGLGGAMWWESSADRKGHESLISRVSILLVM